MLGMWDTVFGTKQYFLTLKLYLAKVQCGLKQVMNLKHYMVVTAYAVSASSSAVKTQQLVAVPRLHPLSLLPAPGTEVFLLSFACAFSGAFRPFQ